MLHKNQESSFRVSRISQKSCFQLCVLAQIGSALKGLPVELDPEWSCGNEHLSHPDVHHHLNTPAVITYMPMLIGTLPAYLSLELVQTSHALNLEKVPVCCSSCVLQHRVYLKLSLRVGGSSLEQKFVYFQVFSSFSTFSHCCSKKQFFCNLYSKFSYIQVF